MRLWVYVLVGVVTAVACAQEVSAPQALLLWDFEAGNAGWWANPWSGGKASQELASGRYGQGLHCIWQDIPQAGNVISPYLDENAPWRSTDWRYISLWFRGDGSPATVTLSVHTAGPAGQELSYSRSLPLDSTEWRHTCLDMGTFWNREGIPFDGHRIRRILFSGSRTHELWVDHIALEPPQLRLPVEGEAGPPVELRALSGAVEVWLDPGSVSDLQSVSATITGADGAAHAAAAALASPPGDDVRLRFPPPAEGPAQLQLTCQRADGTAVEATYRFAGLASRPRLQPWPGLLPTPKELTPLSTEEPFQLSETLTLTAFGPEEQVRQPTEYLARRLEEACDVRTRVLFRAAPGDGLGLVIAAEQAGAPAAPSAAVRRAGDEAYELRAGNGRLVLCAMTRRGLRWGAMTALQLLHEAYRTGQAVPSVQIVDWPELPVRGITIPFPTDRWGYPNDAPVDPAFYRDFLLRLCLEHKLNTVILLVHQGMVFTRRPEVTGPAAWPQDTVRALVAALRENDIEVIPGANSLGHANWLVIPLKQLREDGDTQTLCTSHPDSAPALLDCYQELIDVFQPKYFHIGMDEVRWQTLNKPEAERCPLCKGLDKRDVFLRQVQMLHDFFRARGITTLMWGDMVLRAHNGGPPFFLADDLEKLPVDITICNWSQTLDPLSDWQFQRLGHRVLQSNSRGIGPAQRPYVTGNLFGVWAKHPWITEGAVGPFTEYSFLPVLVAAEYSWNLYPDALAPSVPMSREFFEDRRDALTALAAQAPPDALPIRLELSDQPVTCAVDTVCSGLRATVSLHLSEERRTQLREAAKKKENWQGVPVVELVMRYATGREEVRLLRYGYDVRDTMDPLPYAFNAAGYETDATGRTWYTLAWRNPTPQETVTQVQLRFVADH